MRETNRFIGKIINKCINGLRMLEFFFPVFVFVTVVAIELVYLGSISFYDAVIQAIGFFCYFSFLVVYCYKINKRDEELNQKEFSTEEEARRFSEELEVRRTREVLGVCIVQVCIFFGIILITGLIETLLVTFMPWVFVFAVCGLYHLAKLIAIGDVDYIRGSRETKLRKVIAYCVFVICIFGYCLFLYFIPIEWSIKLLLLLLYFLLILCLFLIFN